MNPWVDPAFGTPLAIPRGIPGAAATTLDELASQLAALTVDLNAALLRIRELERLREVDEDCRREMEERPT